MTTITTPSSIVLMPGPEAAWQDVDISFNRFWLVAGIGAIQQVLREDAQRLTGPRHGRGGDRVGHRWRQTKGKIGFHGGNAAVQLPRVRGYDGHKVELPSWTAAQTEDWLGRWAMNLMLINVSTSKLRRAVRPPEGDLPAIAGDGTSKSAASCRFVALSAERLAEWMASHLSKLDLWVTLAARSSKRRGTSPLSRRIRIRTEKMLHNRNTGRLNSRFASNSLSNISQGWHFYTQFFLG